jgi:hypothetical protein
MEERPAIANVANGVEVPIPRKPFVGSIPRKLALEWVVAPE